MSENSGDNAKEKAAEVLLVEDSETFCHLVKKTLAKSKTTFNISIAKDGVEAMECLRKTGDFAHVPTPDFILLDINMPRMDGHEVLAEVKSDPELRIIPIIMMTASSSADDIKRSYDHHANLYIVKPLSVSEFEKTMNQIEQFWISVASLPGN